MSETFEKPLEQRVEELESLVWEFPTLMNMRFERFDTEFTSMRSSIDDNTRRLSQVERGFNLIQADIRDLRNGMIRLLGAHSAKIGDLDGRTRHLEKEVAGMRLQVGQLDDRIGDLNAKVGNMDAKVGSMDAKVGDLDAKVGSMDQEVGSLSKKIDEVLSLLRSRG